MEIMSSGPRCVELDSTVLEAADMMRRHSVGSLLVLSKGAPVGIITERDLVTKVMAEDGVPSEFPVAEIMSRPVVSVHPHTEVVKAAREMADHGIRRLAVMEDDELVGIVTENDIIKVWPRLIEITREAALIGVEGSSGATLGYCELCGAFSENLLAQEGQLLCGECRER